MKIYDMVVEELRGALGDRAEDMSADVYQAVGDGAVAARRVLGSDVLYENFLSRQAKRLQANEEEEAEAERSQRRRFPLLNYDDDDKPARPTVPTSRFFE
jgi:hypothetical protein